MLFSLVAGLWVNFITSVCFCFVFFRHSISGIVSPFSPVWHLLGERYVALGGGAWSKLASSEMRSLCWYWASSGLPHAGLCGISQLLPPLPSLGPSCPLHSILSHRGRSFRPAALPCMSHSCPLGGEGDVCLLPLLHQVTQRARWGSLSPLLHPFLITAWSSGPWQHGNSKMSGYGVTSHFPMSQRKAGPDSEGVLLFPSTPFLRNPNCI